MPDGTKSVLSSKRRQLAEFDLLVVPYGLMLKLTKGLDVWHLRQNSTNVGFNGALGGTQLRGDLLDGVSSAEQPVDAPLCRAETIGNLVGLRACCQFLFGRRGIAACACMDNFGKVFGQ